MTVVMELSVSATVGRVGGLAVALGVGAAALTGQVAPGMAWAETPGGSTSTDSSSSAPSGTSGDESSTDTSEPSAGATDTGSPAAAAETDGDEDRTAPPGVVVATGGAQHDSDDSDKESNARSGTRRLTDTSTEPTVTVRESKATVTDTVSDEEPSKEAVEEIEPELESAVMEIQPAVETVSRSVGADTPAVPTKVSQPTSVAAELLSSVVNAVLAPFAANGPVAPTPPPIPLAFMALARREFEGALLTGTPETQSVGTPLVAAATMADATFTGQPSFVAQVVTFGLRLIKPILSLFGLELNGTSARIPFFTDGIPPFFVTGGLSVTSSEYEGWKVWTLAPPEPTDKVVVAVHGGSFIATASLFHWWTYSDLARQTGATVVVPLYPTANAEGTGGTAKTVVPTVADFIAAQVGEHGAENVSVLGDSAGGSIALAAAQQLVIRCNGDQACLDATLPGRMVLMSPALDAGVTNPDVASVDDPLLNPTISKRNGQWWAKGLETPADPDGTKNPLASPIYGSLANLPPTAVYAGSLDSRTPDVLVLQQNANATPGADFTFELRNGQIHDWTIFPFLPDAHVERPNIYRDLGLT